MHAPPHASVSYLNGAPWIALKRTERPQGKMVWLVVSGASFGVRRALEAVQLWSFWSSRTIRYTVAGKHLDQRSGVSARSGIWSVQSGLRKVSLLFYFYVVLVLDSTNN